MDSDIVSNNIGSASDRKPPVAFTALLKASVLLGHGPSGFHATRFCPAHLSDLVVLRAVGRTLHEESVVLQQHFQRLGV